MRSPIRRPLAAAALPPSCCCCLFDPQVMDKIARSDDEEELAAYQKAYAEG
jgi:hypothetical protein